MTFTLEPNTHENLSTQTIDMMTPHRKRRGSDDPAVSSVNEDEEWDDDDEEWDDDEEDDEEDDEGGEDEDSLVPIFVAAGIIFAVIALLLFARSRRWI